jgi:hypothetical protein
MSLKVERSPIRKKIDSVVQRKKMRFIAMTTQFMHENKDVLIIIADPKTDLMVMGYDDAIVPVRILDAKKKPMGLVSKVVKCAKNKSYDKYMHTFLHFVDGGVFNISRLILTRKSKGREKIIKVHKGTFISKCLHKIMLLKKRLKQKLKPKLS